LAGTVVHLAVETATKEFARAGFYSPRSPGAVAVMKKLGGYSALLGQCIDRVLNYYADNPRTKHLIENARQKLRSEVPEMRMQVQKFLGSLRLESVPPIATASKRTSGDQVRSPLGPGAYPEIVLKAATISWMGKVDLLTISDSSCEIIDFKTGVPSDQHTFQLRVYALLWSRDKELNPSARKIDKLTVVYRSNQVAVDVPFSAELDKIDSEIVSRTIKVRVAAEGHPPEARPSTETCRFCSVRQLCKEYWQADIQQRIGGESTNLLKYIDVEMVITDRHGPMSWDGVVVTATRCTSGTRIVLRATNPSVEFRAGDRLRVLDAHLAMPEHESDPSTVTMGVFSEVFKEG
ncbi:MAG: PD-(D/E)XK nuclease family protein, partial [Patescibacteria group bacterium]